MRVLQADVGRVHCILQVGSEVWVGGQSSEASIRIWDAKALPPSSPLFFTSWNAFSYKY
jgi:hypothetical protein